METTIVSDPELTKYFATLGVGGVLAVIMFMVYRKDVKQYTDLWKDQSNILVGIVKDNTAAITKNTAVVESFHQRLDSEFFRERDRSSNGGK